MLWYRHLYMGERAKKRRFSIIRDIRRNHIQPDIYVITPASNGNNLLDIYPSASFLHPHYQEKEMMVLGLAVGHDEAMEVAGAIVSEMYRTTGELKLHEFLEEK